MGAWFPVKDCPAAGVDSRLATGASDWVQATEVLASSFSLPAGSVRRAMPVVLFESPSIDHYVARKGGEALSTVALTYHGSVAGVWAMGTRQEAQGQGVGKALLSRAMCECRDRGMQSFFLGATHSGFPLYERLGYQTRFAAQVWIRGESHQV